MQRPSDSALTAEAREYIAYLEQRLANMNNLYLNLQKAHFGSKSEKQKSPIPEDCEQTCLFNEAEQAADAKAQDPTSPSIEIKAHTRAKKRTREELLDGLPTTVHEFELPEGEGSCPRCEQSLTKIGREYIRKECEYIPAHVEVHEYYRATYVCHHCEDGMPECATCERAEPSECATCKSKPGTVLVKAAIPLQHQNAVLKHSIASATTVAQVLYDKYVMAIPLNRQVQDWARAGLKMNRATLANWVLAVHRDYFSHMRVRMREALLCSSVIHCDETAVQVLREPGRKATSSSYMWAYRSGASQDRQIVIFDYQPSRSGDCAKRFLDGYNGYYVTDGYAGYNKVPFGTRCGCMAHVRRKFLEAIPGADPTNECKAKEGFDFCEKLFSIERELADLTPEARKQQRDERSRPVLDDFWNWCAHIDASRSTPLAKAVGYATGQKRFLCNFLLDGRIPISNNLDENAIRPFVVGRKNWLFCNTPDGALASAAIYSVVETAKANGLDVYKYLCFLLIRMPASKNHFSPDFLDSLMPWSTDALAFCR